MGKIYIVRGIMYFSSIDQNQN